MSGCSSGHTTIRAYTVYNIVLYWEGAETPSETHVEFLACCTTMRKSSVDGPPRRLIMATTPATTTPLTTRRRIASAHTVATSADSSDDGLGVRVGDEVGSSEPGPGLRLVCAAADAASSSSARKTAREGEGLGMEPCLCT